MKKIYLSAFLFALMLLIGWQFFLFGTGKGYNQYRTEGEYRRLHPEFLPSPILVRTFDMGHSSAYASWTWLQLIQYIGDNVGGNQFLAFSNALLEHITILHPYFIRPYEINLILAPTSFGENMNADTNKQNKIYTHQALSLGRTGMATLCNPEKLQKIRNEPISQKLWNNAALKHPCASGMLPYYMAFATYQMADKRALSSEYYKIASMNDDAPKASGLLSIIALSAEGDYQASALNFALIATTGYDVEPYNCRHISATIVDDLMKKRIINTSWVQELGKKELEIQNHATATNIISGAGDSCYNMTTRSIESIFLNYIANLSVGTMAKNGDDLIKIGLLKDIPTISTKKGFTVRKRSGIWEYQSKK